MSLAGFLAEFSEAIWAIKWVEVLIPVIEAWSLLRLDWHLVLLRHLRFFEFIKFLLETLDSCGSRNPFGFWISCWSLWREKLSGLRLSENYHVARSLEGIDSFHRRRIVFCDRFDCSLWLFYPWLPCSSPCSCDRGDWGLQHALVELPRIDNRGVFLNRFLCLDWRCNDLGAVAKLLNLRYFWLKRFLLLCLVVRWNLDDMRVWILFAAVFWKVHHFLLCWRLYGRDHGKMGLTSHLYCLFNLILCWRWLWSRLSGGT